MELDLIHDALRLCARLKTDGTKANFNDKLWAEVTIVTFQMQ